MAEIEPTQVPAPIDEQASEEADVEGHSANLEFNRTVAREHNQAAERAALANARHRERAPSRSFLDRVLGR